MSTRSHAGNGNSSSDLMKGRAAVAADARLSASRIRDAWTTSRAAVLAQETVGEIRERDFAFAEDHCGGAAAEVQRRDDRWHPIPRRSRDTRCARAASIISSAASPHPQQAHLAQVIEAVFVDDGQPRALRSSAASHSSTEPASIASNSATSWPRCAQVRRRVQACRAAHTAAAPANSFGSKRR